MAHFSTTPPTETHGVGENSCKILLESLLSRKGATWVAEKAALILKGWAESGYLPPDKVMQTEFAARAFWAAHEEMESLQFVQT